MILSNPDRCGTAASSSHSAKARLRSSIRARHRRRWDQPTLPAATARCRTEMEKPMTDTERPEIGATVDANEIKTNYLEAGEGAPVVLIHGSGPGVTAYANWRLVIPVL